MSHVKIRLGKYEQVHALNRGSTRQFRPQEASCVLFMSGGQEAAEKLEMRFNSAHGAPKCRVSVDFQTYLALN